ncbi:MULTISPECIES: DUF4229 domain-containing protein [unclassified Micromonospora]|uniref:DUF4229 domain-containing protein n=1 Tax=Micromonospora TaxID=1873 RepID=UPI00188DE854|nr:MULTISPECIES: DUF4229 domain-containing protein [unclassified Micromonospora]MBF5032340.1 DUF4229 domain-containing protein [Micromonospora sp. ANENR4]MCZ7478700.1 DUF4229 domain-containing protein [Micromonospora sp. WMMC273]MDW3845331.1 DUF4229 domain-containing protein [Micromonospora sp. BRA006-A]MEE3919266.1 DUF4229 domain-containing protein [Micromonospora sp. BRA006-A]WBC03380.1 DUF4229 domain-containing protein [Micromonospora sp. WMMA1976]
MSAAVKYTLGRVGLFVAVLAALWFVEMNMFLRLMVALISSAALSFFLLRNWRDEMAGEMAEASERRRAEKDRLRSALAGDDEPGTAPATEPDAERRDG